MLKNATCNIWKGKKYKQEMVRGVKKAVWAYPFDDILDERHLHRHEVHLGKKGGNPVQIKLEGGKTLLSLEQMQGNNGGNKTSTFVCKNPPLPMPPRQV